MIYSRKWQNIRSWLALMAVLAIAAGCTAAMAEEHWTCPNCGETKNTGKYCMECGEPRPADEWTCPNCGQAGNTGKFCPECGTARAGGEKAGMVDFGKIRPGYRFFFGKFEQDGFETDGEEPIVWRVLDTDESSGTVLAISEYGLYTLKYHRNNKKTYWGDTDVRSWLNSEFLTAFTEEERYSIVPTEVSGSPDYCFLLDPDQVRRYLSRPYICYATPYALEHGEEGAYVNESTGGSSWLVRTDVAERKIAWVGGGGDLYVPGGKGTNYLYTKDNVARPVMWLKAEAAVNEAVDYGFPLYAKTIETTIATRSGPSTGFNGIGSYPKIGMVRVLSRASDGSIWWLEVEFEYNREIVRCYTGLKRVDIAISRVPDDILTRQPAAVIRDTAAYYGPGYLYKQQVAKYTPSAGTAGTVLKEENGWYCFEYQADKEKVRVWLPGDAVELD